MTKRVCTKGHICNAPYLEVTELRQPTEAGFQHIAERFKVLSDPMRLTLLYALQSGEHSVGEVSEALDLPQPTTSRQLAKLHSAGILKRKREGATVFYSIGDRSILRMCETVCGEIAKSVERKAASLFEK